VNNLA